MSLCAFGSILALAGPAAAQRPAHIHPDPDTAQAGSEQLVGFTVEHGCDASPTVQLEMRLPDGVTDAAPLPIEGWISSVTDNIVTFAGGPLPAEQAQTFQILMTLPPTPDTTIHFPFVQRCEVGEIRWISTDGKADQPAPAMKLVGPVATTVAPSTAAATSSTTAPASTPASTPASEPSSSTVVATSVETTSSSAASAPTSAAQSESSGSSSTGTVVFVVVLAVIAAVGALIATRSRRHRS